MGFFHLAFFITLCTVPLTSPDQGPSLRNIFQEAGRCRESSRMPGKLLGHGRRPSDQVAFLIIRVAHSHVSIVSSAFKGQENKGTEKSSTAFDLSPRADMRWQDLQAGQSFNDLSVFWAVPSPSSRVSSLQLS